MAGLRHAKSRYEAVGPGMSFRLTMSSLGQGEIRRSRRIFHQILSFSFALKFNLPASREEPADNLLQLLDLQLDLQASNC